MASDINMARSNGGADKIKGALDSFTEGVSEIRGDVAAFAGAVGDEVKTRATRLLNTSRAQSERALEQTRTQVRKYPMTAIGAALGTGLVLGMLMRSRR